MWDTGAWLLAHEESSWDRYSFPRIRLTPKFIFKMTLNEEGSTEWAEIYKFMQWICSVSNIAEEGDIFNKQGGFCKSASYKMMYILLYI